MSGGEGWKIYPLFSPLDGVFLSPYKPRVIPSNFSLHFFFTPLYPHIPTSPLGGPTPTAIMSARTDPPPAPYTSYCSVEAPGDLFGMGIRISLYIQWFTTVLAYLYDPDLATECTAVNYVFSIAVAIAALVHPETIAPHAVIIIAMMLLVPPMIIIVALADNIISVYRSPKPSKTTESDPADPAVPEKPDPNLPLVDPTVPVAGDADWRPSPPDMPALLKKHSAADWLREIAVVTSTTFLLIVSVWEFFEGVKIADPVADCRALFIRSHYLDGRYERFLKAFSIMSCIITPLVLIFLIYLRTIPGAEATHLVRPPPPLPPQTLTLARSSNSQPPARQSRSANGATASSPSKARTRRSAPTRTCWGPSRCATSSRSRGAS